MSAPLSRLAFRSAGESHGPAVIAILEGVPRGLALDLDAVDSALRRRQGGAGRGGRQRIEDDRLEVLGGVRKGLTTGAPLALSVSNRDHTIDSLPEPTRPRPGHADLAGCYRYLDRDIRSTLERASARETAARVAAGAICAQLLAAVGTRLLGFVRSVAEAALPDDVPGMVLHAARVDELIAARDQTRLYTLDDAVDRAMLDVVADAGKQGDTVGGVCEVHAVGPVPGLGSCNQWSERLDARLAGAVMSIPAFKGVEVGGGFDAARCRGSAVHDAILPAGEARGGHAEGGDAPGAGVPGGGLARATNRAGGIEAGMTNGQPVVVRGAMKPIATLRRPLASVDLASGVASEAGYERSDVCAVSAASVVVEAMVALVLADATLARLGGERIEEVVERASAHRARCDALGRGVEPSGRG